MKTMKGTDFANILRVANCLSWDEMTTLFGEDVDHYADKLNNKGLTSFIMYLDNENANRFIRFCTFKYYCQQGVNITE